ncbi:helix-hairpin-helix domain-containing protein [Tenacibaculum sp. AHE15PA]|uniref:ComEA family DNA-binding protein n=1 Tax=unclassified Tenacibaculum TaxID=2635139 RepID=UPI001C4F0561|nr:MULTISPECIES: helix-hairpin-helix domain-containing protein [unclassified Tenacibaculum]QXP74421.1 helix-hairpin-helix domain-containing protein [Tenacibaculum sp. AHE14PA]QXP75210.1 helix-hairpin-helix domain-containing protein [Tenacibaculum sp. AHE15PA]
MKIFKSHFWYNKRQRNGIFFLIFIIVILQFVYFFSDFSSDPITDTSSKELLTFQKQIDSLKSVELEKRKPKTYPFNPNYITDFKGEQLGMSLQEIDRLHAYRAQRKFVNSAQEFQEITKVSDSLLNKISLYFKFPDWVVKRNKLASNNKSKVNSVYKETPSKRTSVTTDDINKATQQDFEAVNGVGEVISERIIKYRKKLQGFSFASQLNEVWGVDKSTVARVVKRFKIYEKPQIQKININTATFKEVLKNPYIDYDLCKKIFEYRDEVAELQNIVEIKNIDGFPIEKYDRIVLYLKAE